MRTAAAATAVTAVAAGDGAEPIRPVGTTGTVVATMPTVTPGRTRERRRVGTLATVTGDTASPALTTGPAD
ncbi:hypothetical protein, partial [Mycobacterium marinum]|uniref:hypothetical protein n=1 Tax=Mycobacterium marinum TaxID=1781 RepID=UPI0021C3C010